MSKLKCCHDETKASFAAFFGSTRLLGGQDDGEGGWLLLGTCVACNSTLGIPIAQPRGHTVHGELTIADLEHARVVAREEAREDWEDAPEVRTIR